MREAGHGSETGADIGRGDPEPDQRRQARRPETCAERPENLWQAGRNSIHPYRTTRRRSPTARLSREEWWRLI